MENSEEKLFCPYCRCEITDLTATVCPKCWGDLSSFFEDNPRADKEVEVEEQEAPLTEEAPILEKSEDQPKPTAEIKEPAAVCKKVEEHSHVDVCNFRFNNAIVAGFILFLLIQIFFLYKIDSNCHSIHQDLTSLQKTIEGMK